MISIRRIPYLIVLAAAALGAACAGSGDTGRAPPGRSTSETGEVANSYADEQGDVRDAYARAVACCRRAEASIGSSALVLPILGSVLPGQPSAPAPAPTAPAVPAPNGTLVLYDETGTWGWLGELYAINVGALVSHFGTWTAKPARRYTAGELAAYSAVVYVGSTFDEQLPMAFLDDVLAGTRPVVWLDHNIWQLAARSPTFATSHGFQPWFFDASDTTKVNYKGVTLSRYTPNAAGLMTYSSLGNAQVLAEAERPNGTRLPWAVRGGNVTYIGENPLTFVTANDRYLVFADLLFDALAPATAERHRALVRIEDVSPDTDPAALRAIADYLASVRVPFSVATIPTWVDPRGAYNGGVPKTVRMSQAPAVADALRYMGTKGGTLILHGWTHQMGTVNNPYTGATADDFEFYRAHVDANDFVIYDGPVVGDSQTWAASRIQSGLNELALARLPRPLTFEYPHYAGSPADSRAVRGLFTQVYHRGLYFSGQLTGAAPNHARMIGVMYPYKGRDGFGLDVIPENLGSYEPEAANNNAPRLVADLVNTARVNRVVRDGFASFYFHPYYDVSILQQLITGIQAQGYTFVAANTL